MSIFLVHLSTRHARIIGTKKKASHFDREAIGDGCLLQAGGFAPQFFPLQRQFSKLISKEERKRFQTNQK
jgi:hypothetical protein